MITVSPGAAFKFKLIIGPEACGQQAKSRESVQSYAQSRMLKSGLGLPRSSCISACS
jgi:hypothetical protein